MTAIVGISAHYHDAACCILRDGVLVAAAQEERFTKLKHDAGTPTEAFRYCLREAGVSISDITCLAYYENPAKKAARQLWAGLPELLTDPRRRFRVDPGRAEAELRDALGYDGDIEIVDHHLSHAASAFLFSGFPDAAILTVDGVGEWATTCYGSGTGTHLEILEEVSFPHSLGLLYSAITAYLGFEVNDGEYKVMGLAAYGRPIHADRVRRLIDLAPGGQFRLDQSYFDFRDLDCMYTDALCALFGQPARTPESTLTEFHEDVAASIQLVLEEVLLDKLRYLHEQRPSENLCMAGGVALNCVANGRIREEGPFSAMFVQPAAGDAGGCLGAAAIAQMRRGGGSACLAPMDVHLGPSPRKQEVTTILREGPWSERATCFEGDEKSLAEAAATRLADGRVLGWLRGRMEFGPRALGARSIVADPRRPEMKDRVNELVKMRESFRPFAPAVLAEEMAAHFQPAEPSPFMLETRRVISPLSLPAITHVDGTARVQTVDAVNTTGFRALLEAFFRLTGCPILLNTSFNLRGDPIALDAADAMWTAVASKLDVLVIDDWLVDCGQSPPALAALAEMIAARNAKRRASRGAPTVYTFL